MKKENLQLQIRLSLYSRDVYETLASAEADLTMSDRQMLYYALDAQHNQFGEVCRFLVTDLISQIEEPPRGEESDGGDSDSTA